MLVVIDILKDTMKNFKKILASAKKFELKYVFGQQMSAQPDDIARTLKAAGMFDLSAEVGPLLNQAKVPDTAAVDIKINVNKGNKVTFTSLLTPSNAPAASALSILLQKKYSTKMSDILTKANISVTDSLLVNWLTF